ADVAPAPGDVEGEAAGGEALAFGVGLGGEEGADFVEGFDVCNRVRARRAADGGLVDEDDVVEMLRAGEGAEEVRGLGLGGAGLAVEGLHEGAVEDLVDERGFAAAAYSGDTAEQVERDVDVDAAEVVDACSSEAEMLAAGLAAMFGDGDGHAAGEIFSGDGARVGGDFGDGARSEKLAAEFASAGAEVEEIVGGADDVGVVLDDEDGVAEVAEGVHDADELGGVSGVQADGGLVEDVERTDQA